MVSIDIPKEDVCIGYKCQKKFYIIGAYDTSLDQADVMWFPIEMTEKDIQEYKQYPERFKIL